MNQDEYVRHIWYTQSRWGRRRRKRLAIFWMCVVTAAIIGILFLTR